MTTHHKGHPRDSTFIYPIFFLKQGLTLVPRLECSGIITTDRSLDYWAQVILLPQPPQYLGLQACATMPN